MTRARTLKSIVRTRMAKTGERYTTARRHLMASSSRPVEAPPDAQAPALSGADESRGGVTDSKVRERTGKDLVSWFALLDRFGGVEQGHTASARHLREAHGVDSWYSQGITVAYERARGLRTVNQRPGGTFEGSISKTVATAPTAVVRAFATPRGRAGWGSALDDDLMRAVAAAAKGKAPAGFIVRPNGERRCRHRWAGGALELLLTPKADGRTTVLVLHGRVPTRQALDSYRRQWRAALAAMAAALGSDGAGGALRRRGSQRRLAWMEAVMTLRFAQARVPGRTHEEFDDRPWSSDLADNSPEAPLDPPWLNASDSRCTPTPVPACSSSSPA